MTLNSRTRRKYKALREQDTLHTHALVLRKPT